MKAPRRAPVPLHPTHDDIHQLWLQARLAEEAYALARQLVPYARMMPKTRGRVRLLLTSLQGAVRHAWGRHSRAQWRYAKDHEAQHEAAEAQHARDETYRAGG